MSVCMFYAIFHEGLEHPWILDGGSGWCPGVLGPIPLSPIGNLATAAVKSWRNQSYTGTVRGSLTLIIGGSGVNSFYGCGLL